MGFAEASNNKEQRTKKKNIFVFFNFLKNQSKRKEKKMPLENEN